MRNKLCLAILFIMAALPFVGTLSGCNEEFARKQIQSLRGGRLEAEPSPLVFNQKFGEWMKPRIEKVTLFNRSSGDVRIRGLRIVEKLEGEGDLREFFPGPEWLEFKDGSEKVLKSGESLEIEVKYQPRDKLADKAELRIYALGDPNIVDGYISVPLRSLPIEPDIQTVNPMVFTQALSATAWVCRDVMLTNSGSDTLKITNSALQDPTGYFRYLLFKEKPTDGFCKDGEPQSYNGKTISRILEAAESVSPALKVASASPLVVEPRGKAYIRYFFMPSYRNKAEASLIFETNRSGNGKFYRIPVLGNVTDRCLNVNPNPIDFGEIRNYKKTERNVIMNNCGASDEKSIEIKSATVKSIKFVPDRGAELTVAAGTLNADMFQIKDDSVLPFTLDPGGQKKSIDIVANLDGTFAREGTLYGELTLVTDDPVNSVQRFEVTADLRKKVYPIAIAKGRAIIRPEVKSVQPSKEGWSHSFVVPKRDQNGDLIDKNDRGIKVEQRLSFELSGEDSVANIPKAEQKGELKYSWTLSDNNPYDSQGLTKPQWLKKISNEYSEFKKENIKVQFSIQTEAEASKVIPGDYEFILKVRIGDDATLESEKLPASKVIVRVQPVADIFVQLTWVSMPAENEQPVKGKKSADLDLHLLTTREGRWGQGEDVFAENESLRSGSNEIKLTNDDKGEGSGGPETIFIKNPKVNAYYSVGVNYIQANGFGVAYVVVRIYFKGELTFATVGMPPRGYLRDSEFWDVACLTYCRASNGRKDRVPIITHNEYFENIAEANKRKNKCSFMPPCNK